MLQINPLLLVVLVWTQSVFIMSVHVRYCIISIAIRCTSTRNYVLASSYMLWWKWSRIWWGWQGRRIDWSPDWNICLKENLFEQLGCFPFILLLHAACRPICNFEINTITKFAVEDSSWPHGFKICFTDLTAYTIDLIRIHDVNDGIYFI